MSRDLLKELRRYAGSGKTERVESILRCMIKQDPNDCFAATELQRLRTGKKLYSAADYKSYRYYLHLAANESLRVLTQRHAIASLPRMSKRKLQDLHHTFTQLEARMQNKHVEENDLQEYKRALKRELRKQALRGGKKIAIGAGIPLFVLLFLGLAGWQMREHAKTTAQALDSAVAAEDWPRVHAIKVSAGSGINRLLYSPTEAAINKAEAWIAHKKALHREAGEIIDRLNRGQDDIKTLPLAKRALMERYLRELPKELNDISPIWQRYCDQIKQQWLQEIPEKLAQIQAPLPGLPAWSGTKDDADTAQSYAKNLQTLLGMQQDTVDAYHLDTSLLAPLRERISEVKKLQKEIVAWQETLKALAEATDYDNYIRALKKLGTPACYPPAVKLLQSVKDFPEVKTVQDIMQNPNGKVPPTLLPALNRILLEKGATFCVEGPAEVEQVELLNDLFTTRALRTKLYRISTPQGDVAFSTSPFDMEGKYAIRFKRAELDPAFHIGRDMNVVWDSSGVRQHLVNPTGLVAAAGLERRTFFISTNLPAAMSAVLNYQHKDCPALAKAYVYDILLRVVQMHKAPALIGAEYSPSLLADARSFIALRDTLGIELRADCWLQPTRRAEAAEELMQEWFNQRKGHNYAAEIKKNYGELAAVHPVYVGFVAPNGQAVTCREIPKGDEIWYQGENGLSHDIRRDTAYAQAIPFSPIFIKARDKKKKH